LYFSVPKYPAGSIEVSLYTNEEPPPPPRKTGGYKPPPPPSPEEIARREAEKAEEARWLERAKASGPPEPPKAVFQPGSSEEQYKEYMRVKYEHERWENQMILLSRKMRAEAQAAGQA